MTKRPSLGYSHVSETAMSNGKAYPARRMYHHTGDGVIQAAPGLTKNRQIEWTAK